MSDTEWLIFLDDCESRAWRITNHNLAHGGKRLWVKKARIIVRVSEARTKDQEKYFYWWTVFDRKTNKILIRGKHKSKVKATEAATESKDLFVEKLCPNKENVL